MRRLAGLLVLAVTVAACGGASGVEVTDARVPEPFANTAALYLSAESPGEPDDRLLEVRVPGVEETRLHEMVIGDDGFAAMVDVDAFDLPAGGTLELAPGARHVMLLGIASLEVGEVVEVDLVWEHAGVMSIEAEVVPAGSGW